MNYIETIVGFLGNDIINEGECLEGGEAGEGIKIRKSNKTIVGEDEGIKVRKRFTKIGCNFGDVVVVEEETTEAEEEGEVLKLSYLIIGEVNGVVLILSCTNILYLWNFLTSQVQLSFSQRIDDAPSTQDEVCSKTRHSGDSC